MALWDELPEKELNAGAIAQEMPVDATAAVWVSKEAVQRAVAERKDASTQYAHGIRQFILERPKAFYPVVLRTTVAKDDEPPTRFWERVDRVARDDLSDFLIGIDADHSDQLREIAQFSNFEEDSEFTLAAVADGGKRYARVGNHGNKLIQIKTGNEDFHEPMDIRGLVKHLPEPNRVSVEDYRVIPEYEANPHLSPSFPAGRIDPSHVPEPSGGPFGDHVQEVDTWDDEGTICATVRTYGGEVYDFRDISGDELAALMDEPVGKPPEELIPESLQGGLELDDGGRGGANGHTISDGGLSDLADAARMSNQSYSSYVEYGNGSRIATPKGNSFMADKLRGARQNFRYSLRDFDISAKDLESDAIDAMRTSLHEAAAKSFRANFTVKPSEEMVEKLREEMELSPSVGFSKSDDDE